MPGRSPAPRSGATRRDRIAGVGTALDIDARIDVRVGRLIWGA